MPAPGGHPAGLTQLAAHALKVFLRIDAGARHLFRHGDVDLLAVPQHPQLFEHLYLLQRARGPADVAADKPGAVAVNADMAQQRVADSLAAEGKAIPVSRNGGAGEIERIALGIHHHFDRVRIKRLFGIADRHRQRRHA